MSGEFRASVKVGPYFPDREERAPPLTAHDTCTVDHFQHLHYRRWLVSDTNNLSWFGYMAVKNPCDMWMYQELLVRTRPDFVIQTGTFCGGSALFLAMILDLLGHGRVISIDMAANPKLPTHPRLTYVLGSSTDPEVVDHISKQVGSGRAMVILDSDHSEAHVYDEILAYSPFVQIGDYLIVEDTNVNGHPIYPDYGPGPMEAVVKFLAENESFCADRACERFMMTGNPNGYLRRCA